MPRIVAFLASIVFFDAMLFGALIPLLPGLADDLDLSKAEAGLLFGSYGAGALVFGLPAGLVISRIGPKRAIVAGMIVVAVSSVAFAFAGSLTALSAARFVQGCGSLLTWTGALGWVATSVPRERRGQALGTTFGIAVFGFVVGPLIGTGIEALTIRVAFLIVAAIALVLALVTLRRPSPPPEVGTSGAIRRAVRDPRFLAGLWLNLLPAFFFGLNDTLAPLNLDAAGYGTLAIGIVFFVSGLLEVGANPLVGRVSDTRGRFLPIQAGLAAAVLVSVALALTAAPLALSALVAVSSVAYGAFYTPGLALVADRADDIGLTHGTGFGITNTAWAFGATAGPWIGGGLADALGDAVPYLVCAALCLLTLLAGRQQRSSSAA